MKNVFFALAFMLIANLATAQTTYIIDGGHSSVVFSLDYNFTEFYGSFAGKEGTVVFEDENDFATAKVEIKINVASINTNNEGRDEHLQGERYLNAGSYGEATFKSKTIKKLDNNTYEMTGDLTIAGKTLSETVLVKVLGKGKSERAGEIMGIKATFSFNRSNYGIGGGIPVMSDKTNVIASVQLVKEVKEDKKEVDSKTPEKKK